MSTSDLTISSATLSQAATILRINQDNVPEVGPLDSTRLGQLMGQADRVLVALRDKSIVGFAILLTEGSDYASPNYRWFHGRHSRFYYVDRIAVDEGSRASGVGGALYRAAFSRAYELERTVICAEVNVVPPNPRSMGFHRRFGFEEVGRLQPYGPDAEVAMLEASTAPA